MPEKNYILFCQCAERGIGSAAVRGAVLAGLRARGVPFAEVPDLCRLAADKARWLAEMAAASGKLSVVACHPRAVRWLLAASGIAAGAGRFQFLDLRAQSAADILAALPASASACPAPPAAADPWPPWFPVIDFSRCRQCRQCVNFCLFGVYAIEAAGRVAVNNPRACKNSCPACARICPEAAIMFPKLPDAEAPLNGAEILNGQDLKERARVNLKELLGNDVYAALARRRAQARARLLKPDLARAAAERAACAAQPGAENKPAATAADGQPEG